MAYPPYFTDMPLADQPPQKVAKVVSRTVWDLLDRQWRDFKSKSVPPPTLAPPSARKTYITDAESLEVCAHVVDFGLRLSLFRPDLFQISAWGCVVVNFDRGGWPWETPERNPGAVAPSTMTPPPAGLTQGGAREWILNVDVKLSPAMEVFVIESSGARWGPVIL